MSDSIRDTFLTLLKQGHSRLEAFREFDEAAFHAAVSAEIDNEEVFRNPETFAIETADGRPSLLDLAAKAQMERCDESAMEQAIELWMAGWKSEPPYKGCMVMSWYWRRPPRRKGSKGMQFLSTQQAFNALKRENKTP